MKSGPILIQSVRMSGKKANALDSLISGSSGFTLIELVIIIAVLTILAVSAIPRIGNLIETSKINATESELSELKRAIVGTPQVTGGNNYTSRGFENDVGFVPSRLEDLVAKPGSVSVYNRITGMGWNGPYIDSTDGEYLRDAWDSVYVYAAAGRTITSAGSGASISVSF